MSVLSGSFTPDAAQAYVARQTHLPRTHYADFFGAPLSSIGVGTYLGNPDDATDGQYVQAMVYAVKNGLNMLDTAINYRYQKSERCVGAALRELAVHGIPREAVLVATKGGFLSPDADDPRPPQEYFAERFVSKGIIGKGDVVAGCHVMTPAYIRDQIDASLANMGLSTVDVYYLHNVEMQMEALGPERFHARLQKMFEVLEEAVAAGKVGCYGVATWNGFRQPEDEPNFHDLNRMVQAAEAAAGKDHHFKAVQLPLNLAMTEALRQPNHEWKGQPAATLDVCRARNLYAFASASLCQGQLAAGLPPPIREIFSDQANDGRVALQFVRSSPGLGTALVGMKQLSHVEEALAVAATPPASQEQYARLTG